MGNHALDGLIARAVSLLGLCLLLSPLVRDALHAGSLAGSRRTIGWVAHAASPCPTGGRCIRVTNILGFFVENMTAQDVNGRLLTLPGEFVTGSPPLAGGAGFLFSIQLVR